MTSTWLRRRGVVVLLCLGAFALTPAVAAAPSGTLLASVNDQLDLKLRAGTSGPVRAGTYRLVVSDSTAFHNFHLRGRGVDVKTEIKFKGKKTFTVKLTKGVYRFVCDPHLTFMKGSLRVS